MKRILPVLGYTAAGATIIAAVLVPFVFIDLLTRAFAAIGVRIDPASTGGDVNSVIPRNGYKVAVNHPVRPGSPLRRIEPFVQIAWSPVAGLPARVAEEIDINRDGRPDVRIEFANPAGPPDQLRVDAISESPGVLGLRHIGKDSFSRAIVRDGDRIVVRVPLAR